MSREIVWPEDTDEELKDLVLSLLRLDPMSRLGAGMLGSGNSYSDLKDHSFFDGVDWDDVGTSENF